MLLNNLAAELAFLRDLTHEGLLGFYGAAVAYPPPALPGTLQPFEPGAPCVAVAFELAREGSLEERLAAARRAADAQSDAAAAAAAAEEVLPWSLRLRCAREVASALDFLHCQDIIHRDVKVCAKVLRARACACLQRGATGSAVAAAAPQTWKQLDRVFY